MQLLTFKDSKASVLALNILRNVRSRKYLIKLDIKIYVALALLLLMLSITSHISNLKIKQDNTYFTFLSLDVIS